MIINRSMISLLSEKNVTSTFEPGNASSGTRLPEIIVKTDTAGFSRLPQAGMFNLHPIDRYRYINNGHRVSLDINGSNGNPEQAIKEANQILNKAILPPSDDNPDASQIAQAQLIKRLAQTRLLDMAA